MLSVLICDDSLVARKQVAKCLPQDLERSIHFAKDGKEALGLIEELGSQLLLLDLNMPVMDGYETLSELQQTDSSIKTIVISGDIQPEAHQRVLDLGALDFIEKPVNADSLKLILQKHEMLESVSDDIPTATTIDEQLRDCYQEVANIAMGQAGSHLARALNVFVSLPIPNVNIIDVSELHMMLTDIDAYESTSAVCQGFLGDGISGEALCILNDSSSCELAQITQATGTLDDQMKLEVLMDAASILTGTCLQGFASQLDMQFRQGHPIVLGQQQSVKDLIANNKGSWQQTLAIELSYKLEGFKVSCDLVLLFTKGSIDMMNKKLAHLLED